MHPNCKSIERLSNTASFEHVHSVNSVEENDCERDLIPQTKQGFVWLMASQFIMSQESISLRTKIKINALLANGDNSPLPT